MVIDARKGQTIVDTRGRKALTSITMGTKQIVDVDCLAVSGGWSPNVHLTCHHRGRPEWREDIAGFVPGGDLPPAMHVAGAANGAMTLSAALREGHDLAVRLARDLGASGNTGDAPDASDERFDTANFWPHRGPFSVQVAGNSIAMSRKPRIEVTDRFELTFDRFGVDEELQIAIK